MDFLLNKIVEWIKDILVGGIMDNLNGLFDGINGQVAGIAGTVGATPQSWNSSVFNMIKGLSDNIIVPVAGIVLTAVMCYELIQMVIDRNSLHDFETFVFFKWVVKAARTVLSGGKSGEKVKNGHQRITYRNLALSRRELSNSWRALVSPSSA